MRKSISYLLALLVVIGAVAGITAALQPERATAVDQPVTRSEILDRARAWLGRSDIPYSMGTCYTRDGKRTGCGQPNVYRADCSGFVSLALDVANLTVGSSRPALTPLGGNPSKSVAIEKKDLKPGDLLAYYEGPGADAHIALFVRWQNAVGGAAVVWEQAGGQAGPRENVWSASKHSTYGAFRYTGTREDGGRIAALGHNGRLLVKEGPVNASWSTLYDKDVVSARVAGDRVAILRNDGRALVKEGGLDAGWTTVHDNVAEIKLEPYGKRIAIVTRDGTAKVKEGSLDAGWVTMGHRVKHIAMTGDRIAVIRSDDRAWVKQGSLYAQWDRGVADNVRQITMTGHRIGIVRTDGLVWVKEGPINAAWDKNVATKAQWLALSGNRIGITKTDGTAIVKDGPVNAGWTTMTDHAAGITLAADRIAVRRTDGAVWVKQGSLDAPWDTGVARSIRQISIS